MAKQLLLMRHAKSSHDNPGLSDFDRPLNPRGTSDVPKMAAWLSQNNLTPDIIISSSAMRAETTAKSLADHLDSSEITTEVTEDLYLAPGSIYLEFLARLSEQYSRPMFVGHNPGMENLVQQLGGSNEVMPTCAVAVFEVSSGNWKEIAEDASKFQLGKVLRPKQLFS